MGAIAVTSLGKAYKQYSNHWARLTEWVLPSKNGRHKDKWVLRNISFKISAGESVGIVGVNGAGKSTLLKIITGTTQPTTGQIKVTGRVAALLELGMGFHPDFTGRQNIFMAGQLQGYSNTDLARLLPGILEFAEIGDYIDQPVRVYSSGMQMRLAFAVATAARPDILIVDEALSVGDARFQAKCFQRIAGFKEQGTTLLLVSHSASDIVKHCDRAIMLKNGEIAFDGSARDVTNRYMDELFGKSSAPKSDNEPRAFPASGSTITDEVDRFHERPGYRKEEHRWGHGGAKILDYTISSKGELYPSSLESTEVTDFYIKVKFERDFPNVVPGFLLKTLEGIFLYGTNSFLSTNGKELVSARAGDIKIFKFSMPVRLNEGNYLVSFGVSSGDPLHDLIPLDRRYDSILLHIHRPMQFWGIVDLESSFEIPVQ